MIVMSNYVVIVWLILLCNGTTEKGVKERGRERRGKEAESEGEF